VSPPGQPAPGGPRPPVNPDETVQLRFTPQPPPRPPAPPAQADVRPWWAFLPTLIWLAAAAFTIGAMIALS